MDKKLLNLYGLKWNPFSPVVPVEAMYLSDDVETFTWRVEHLAREGGFALLTGDPGTGKSVVLRQLTQKLNGTSEIRVGILTRPQCSVADFYREMGDIFEVKLSPGNRWGGTKVLRDRWQQYIEQSLFRPVLVIDEAQEVTPAVLTELRLLYSAQLDSKQLLTVVLSGDERLPQRFRQEELVPIGSRIRVRLNLTSRNPKSLEQVLTHMLDAAGNPALMSDGLKDTLCEHSVGNLRVLMTMGDELLAMGVKKQVKQLDEQLYFEAFHPAEFHNRSPQTKKSKR